MIRKSSREHRNPGICPGERGIYTWALPIVSFMLTSCGEPSKTEAAEKRLEMVQRVGTLGEACEAAKAVSNAYLEAGDEEEYKFAHVSAAVKCQSADLIGTHLPAEEKRRKQVEADVHEIDRRIDASIEGATQEGTGG